MSASPHSAADTIDQSLLVDFLDESSQLLDCLGEKILIVDQYARLNKSCDLDLLNEMFRAVHSIKGLSAMLGLGEINQLTHRFENILDSVRKNQLALNCQVTQVLFQGMDTLTVMIRRLSNPTDPFVDTAEVCNAMQQLLQAGGVAREMTTQQDAEAVLTALQIPAVTPSERIDRLQGVADEADIPAKYLAIFIDETSLSLDELTDLLININPENGRHALETLLITAHRIKGGAASIGLQRAMRLAHVMEDILQLARERNLTTLPGGGNELFLKCVDQLRIYIDGMKQGKNDSGDFGFLVYDLECYQQAWNNGTLTASQSTTVMLDHSPQVITDSEPTVSKQTECEVVLQGVVEFKPGLPLAGMKARLIFEKLNRCGELLHFDPPPAICEQTDGLSRIEFVLAPELTTEKIKAQLQISGVGRVEISKLNNVPVMAPCCPPTPVAAVVQPQTTVTSATATTPTVPQTQAVPAKPVQTEVVKSAAATALSQPAPSETLRVDIERLDQLMNLTGQLVINKSSFHRIGDKLKFDYNTNDQAGNCRRVLRSVRSLLVDLANASGAAGSTYLNMLGTRARKITHEMQQLDQLVTQVERTHDVVLQLQDAVNQLDRISDGLQKSVMDTRMVPIGPLFSRFKRVVRDVTRINGKDIELVLRGEKTELDKRMIDELGDPLIHMVRNSADHGIESPAERTAAGKPARGSITLDAFHRGNSIIVQVSDDGKGMDPERIRSKAVEKGIVSPVDAEKLTSQQVLNLIWEPGFSTAEKITEISGRGMGMDIVRSKIEQINGTVELTSTLGVGTTFTIKLPLTLAIMPSLLSQYDGDIFALPLESIVEIICVEPNQIKTVHGQRTALVRGRTISIASLDELFQWSRPGAAPQERNPQCVQTMIVISDNGMELGMIVDNVLGESDIVIKSLADNYRNINGVAGASILGDGRVALILDSAALVDIAARGNHAALNMGV